MFLKIFAKFTGKHRCQSLIFNKVAGLNPANLLKRDSNKAPFYRTLLGNCIRKEVLEYEKKFRRYKHFITDAVPFIILFRTRVKKKNRFLLLRLLKRCSKNMQQIYRRTPMRKCDFNKVAKQLYWNRVCFV